MSDLESANFVNFNMSRPSEDEPRIERKHFYILAALYLSCFLSVFLAYRVLANLPFWEEVTIALFIGLPLSSLGLFLLLLIREIYLIFLILLRFIKKLNQENIVIN